MPSDSLSINPKSTSSNQESVASFASSQHGHLHEHGPTIDGCFEQKKPERGKTEGLERAGDLGTSTASSTEICAAQESGRLGEVSDVLERSRDIFNHSKPSSASSKRDSTLVVGGLTKPSASSQFSGVEKLPNGKRVRNFLEFMAKSPNRGFNSYIFELSTIKSCRQCDRLVTIQRVDHLAACMASSFFALFSRAGSSIYKHR